MNSAQHLLLQTQAALMDGTAHQCQQVGLVQLVKKLPCVWRQRFVAVNFSGSNLWLLCRCYLLPFVIVVGRILYIDRDRLESQWQ